MSSKSNVSKRALSSETSALLVMGTETHVKAATSCIGQAAEILDLQTAAAKATDEDDEEVDLLDPLGLSTQRAIHELEAAVHAAALTQIGCTLATLEALGYEVRGLCEVRWEAEAREKKADESPS